MSAVEGHDILVSICVPTYNGGRWLGECLESALTQQLTAPFEVVVVDDGSSDDTTRIAEVFSERDPRVRLVRNPSNLGLVGNWNRCVDLAKGEWIKFLFQDDLLRPGCLDRMLAAARSSGSPFVVCSREFEFSPAIAPDLRSQYILNRDAVEAGRSSTWHMEADAFATLIAGKLDYNYLGEPSSVLLHRDTMRERGPFDPRFVQLVDVEYWMRIASVFGVTVVPERLTVFRVHEEATSALNRQWNQFVASGLDALGLFHVALDDPAYVELRDCWERAGLLQSMQHRRDHWACDVAFMVEQQHSGDARLQFRAAYARFLRQFPGREPSRSARLRWQMTRWRTALSSALRNRRP